MIITKTPLRISLFGGGTDYPRYSSRHGGVCVGLAVDKYVYVAVKRRRDFGDGKFRVATAHLDLVDEISDISNPAVKGCLLHAEVREGIEVVHWSDCPGRAGLGSSSSFVVGLCQGLEAMQLRHHTPRSLWRTACHVEQDVLGETVGMQDQAFASFGGVGRFDFPSGSRREIVHTPLPLAGEKLDDFSSHLLLVYTGTQRVASEVAKQYVNDDSTLGMTHQIKAVAEEGWQSLLQGDWEKCGQLLDKTWSIKRALTPLMSSQKIDILYSTARTYGAFGGKLLGAGGGAGCVALMLPEHARENCKLAIEQEFPDCVVMPVGVAESGSRVVYSDF